MVYQIAVSSFRILATVSYTHLLTGSEGWGYTNLPGAEIGEFTGDCGFQDSTSVVTGALGEGRFVLFFPEELHKPGLVQHGCVSVRKAVVKIRMEE